MKIIMIRRDIQNRKKYNHKNEERQMDAGTNEENIQSYPILMGRKHMEKHRHEKRSIWYIYMELKSMWNNFSYGT